MWCYWVEEGTEIKFMDVCLKITSRQVAFKSTDLNTIHSRNVVAQLLFAISLSDTLYLKYSRCLRMGGTTRLPHTACRFILKGFHFSERTGKQRRHAARKLLIFVLWSCQRILKKTRGSLFIRKLVIGLTRSLGHKTLRCYRLFIK